MGREKPKDVHTSKNQGRGFHQHDSCVFLYRSFLTQTIQKSFFISICLSGRISVNNCALNLLFEIKTRGSSSERFPFKDLHSPLCLQLPEVQTGRKADSCCSTPQKENENLPRAEGQVPEKEAYAKDPGMGREEACGPRN